MLDENATMERMEGPRGCDEYEFGSLLDFLNFVFRTSEGQLPTMGASYPHVYRESNRDNFRIIKINGKITSHVAIFPGQVVVGDVTLKVGGIGGVSTHPDYRCRGYAALLLKDCIRKMEEEGFDLSILWTGIPDYYRKFGWENGGTTNIYFLDKGNISLLPKLENCDIREGIEGYFEQIYSLHNQEPLRVMREKDSALAMFLRPKLTTYLASHNGQVIAYLTANNSEVVDYGGDPNTLIALIKEVFESRNLERFFIATPALDYGLPKILDDLRVPKHSDYLGMLRIINLGSLLRKFGLADIKFEQKDNTFILERGGCTAEFSRRELVKLIFGPERISTFSKDVFPVNFYWWIFDHV